MADYTRLKGTEELAKKNDTRLNELTDQFKSLEEQFTVER